MKHTLLFLLAAVMAITVKAQYCPNGDFENWTINPYSSPDSNWYTSNPRSVSLADTLTVWPVTGHTGQAIHIQTAIVGTDTLQAYAINTLGDPKNGTGGVPYSQQPTSIKGYYRYNLLGNDSALMIIEFKKAGAVISVTQLTFRNVSGSVSTFTSFSFPLSAIPVVPDTVIIGMASSNLEGSGLRSGSWLEVDELAFAGTGITQPIPGGSFDNWTTQSIDVPNSWAISSNGNGGTGISRSSVHKSGSYSLQLTTQPGNGSGGGNTVEVAEVTTGHFSPNYGPKGGLPYTHTVDTLTGYYKYTPAGTDTGRINVSLMAAGSMVGGNSYSFPTASAWTYFEMPINASATPDTIRIDIQSGSWFALSPGSVLNIDYLALKSQPLPPLDVPEIITANNNTIVYPTPARDILNIRFNNVVKGFVSAKIYDVAGRIIDNKEYNVAPPVISFEVKNLPGSIYFYEVNNNGNVTRGKFLKE